MSLAFDDGGWPVLLSTQDRANLTAPPVVVAHPSTTPVSVDPLEWARRQDAVREAAREFDDLSDQDLQERLRGATSRALDAGEVSQFRQDVHAQVLDDLVDVLDQNRRGRLRSRRTVRVVAPRGYTSRTKRGLSAIERSDVQSRLRARGWTDDDVHAVFGGQTNQGAS